MKHQNSEPGGRQVKLTEAEVETILREALGRLEYGTPIYYALEVVYQKACDATDQAKGVKP